MDIITQGGRYMAIAAMVAVPHTLAAWAIHRWLVRAMRADFARLDAALQRLERRCGDEPAGDTAVRPQGGPVHDLSCCGCGARTGWVPWSTASARGWRKFCTDRSEYTICPKCRRVGAPEAKAGNHHDKT